MTKKELIAEFDEVRRACILGKKNVQKGKYERARIDALCIKVIVRVLQDELTKKVEGRKFEST